MRFTNGRWSARICMLWLAGSVGACAVDGKKAGSSKPPDQHSDAGTSAPGGDSGNDAGGDGVARDAGAGDAGAGDAGAGDAGGVLADGGANVPRPHWADVAALNAAEIIRIEWNHRAAGAYYSLDVHSGDGTWTGPCVNSGTLTTRLSWDFDGHCSAAAVDVRNVDRVRICSSIPQAPSNWDDASVQCTEAAYAGGTRLHVDSPRDLTNTVVLRWPSIPDASYALHLALKNGTVVDNCASADVLGKSTSFSFHGTCPSQAAQGSVALSAIDRYLVDYAAGAHWDNASSRGRAELAADGQPGDHTLQFPAYIDSFADERCGSNSAADYHFGAQTSFAAETCTSSEPLYQKRRLPERDKYKIAAYPRSYRDADGTTYVLFATPSGGFSPAGNTGCPELNLLVTRNWVDYEVTQIDRLCGYSRLDNGELTVIGGRLYVAYHTITGNGGCTAAGNASGREWVLRLKLSDNYRESGRTFTDLAGKPGYEAIKTLCLPDASVDGFWEPMVYQAGDGSLRVAYSDDTPPESSDNQCNQLIRVIHYSETEHRALSDDAVGGCPGDKRDGMPVVMKSSSGGYALTMESLGAPSAQVVMLQSADGITFGARQVVADTALDGGQNVGCPYLAFDGNTPYISFYHTFLTESGSQLGAFRVRSLDAQGKRRNDRLFELRRHWDAADDLDILYWGSIHVMDGRLHAVAASWSHPFAEAWLPLIP